MTNEELARLFARVIVADILAERVAQPTKKPAAPVVELKPKKTKAA